VSAQWIDFAIFTKQFQVQNDCGSGNIGGGDDDDDDGRKNND
jgi:hypothetical protein